MQEFINICQGNISVKEYRLNFTLLSKFDPTMEEDSRTNINKFVMGISDLLVNECRSSLHFQSIEISCLIVHAKQIEEKKLK